MEIGNKVQIISNTSGHNYMVGETYIIISMHSNMIQLANTNNPTIVCGNSCYPNDLKIVSNKKENLIKKSKKLETKLNLLNSKIEFLIRHKMDKLDEKMFKSYGILEFVNNPEKTEIEKLEFLKSVI